MDFDEWLLGSLDDGQNGFIKDMTTYVEKINGVFLLHEYIESVGTWPKGYKMRFEDGEDVDKTEEWVHNYIIAQVAELEV